MGRAGSPFRSVPHLNPYQYGVPHMSPKMASTPSLPNMRLAPGGNPRRNVSGGAMTSHGVDVYGMIPVGGKHNKNSAVNKADLRSAFVSGSFGI